MLGVIYYSQLFPSKISLAYMMHGYLLKNRCAQGTRLILKTASVPFKEHEMADHSILEFLEKGNSFLTYGKPAILYNPIAGQAQDHSTA
jgi:hypothetical protein